MNINRAGLAGVLISLVAVPVAGAANVTVRVEGESTTLVAQRLVSGNGPNVTKDGATCPGNSAGGALERATGGDWTGTNFSFGISVDSIKGESHTFDTGKYWGFDVNNAFASTGACGYTLQPDDEVLFYAACGDPSATVCFDGKPLDLVAAAGAPIGKPFTVRVDQYDDADGTRSPAAGATVAGGDAPVTTGADGTAEVTVADKGKVTLTATLGKQVRDEAVVRVGSGEYAIPKDTAAPRSRVLGVKKLRTVRARVKDASGLRRVTLGLTRRAGKRCSAFSDAKGRFVKAKCGAHPRFAVGTAKQVSYLLPERLGPGRYTVDVRAVDKAGNREQLARGRNRVVFTVK